MNDARRIAEEQAKALADGEQRRAGDPATSAWTSASAGTGKTTVLVSRVLRLLVEGVRPERILCITYTKAAAAEMANRVDTELSRWAIASDEKLTDLLAGLTGTPPDARRLDRARGLFAHVLETPGGLQIFTIHAFCQTVLKRFPLEAGVAPHFAVIDERDAAAALADSRRAAIEAARANPGGDLAHSLATVAEFAGEESFADLLGTLLEQPERLRAALRGGFAAFTRRLYAALGLAPEDTEAGIVAAACAAHAGKEAKLHLVAEAMRMSGGKTDVKLGETLYAWLVRDGAARAATFGDYLGVFFTKTGKQERRARLVANGTLKLLAEAETIMLAEAARLDAVRERRGRARAAAATAALFCLGGAVLTHYEHRKQSRAALDFADLIARTRALLAAPGRAAWVLWKLDGGIDHVLVDEAQDTSPEQWDLMRLLVDEFFAGEGADRPPRTLFVVGDFKQSIFSFQGAAPGEFRAMHADLRERARKAALPWADVPLIVSFRSTGAVLEAVDKVFALPEARAGVAETGETIKHLTARGGLAGLVEVWPVVAPQDGAAEEPWTEAAPESAAPEPPARLAREIARRIGAWIESEETLESLDRPIHAGDVMILVRRRGAFMDAVVSALKNRGVPVTGIDRMRLMDQLAVQDLVSLGRFLLLPDDDFTMANVLKGPLFGFDDDNDLFPLAHGRAGSLWQRLGEPAPSNPKYAAARQRLESLLARADFAPPYEIFARVLEAEGGRRDILARLGIDAEDPVDEFLELALDYQRRHTPSLEGFLHWLGQGETEIKRDLDHGGGEAVRVMTVHGAKGLQAPIVFLADTVALPQDKDAVLWPQREDGALAEIPLFVPVRADETPEAAARRAALQQRKLEEYRRLLYVALTRAADRLYICGYATKHGVRPGCWYDLVARAFAAEPETPFRFDEHWAGPGWRIERHGKPDRPAERTARRAEAPAEIPAWARTAPAREAPPPRPLAPSRPAEDEPPVRSPFADEARFRRGRIVHRLLQTLPDLPPAARRAAALRYLARPGQGLGADEIESIAAETLALFDGSLAGPACAALFAAGSLAEVPITGVLGAHVVSGQVDRLAIGAGEILVVDYKTNRSPPREPPAIYVQQMAAYRALLRLIYPGRAVRCFLLWTVGPTLAELPAAVLDAAGPARAEA